jgi:hypothetical protein
MIPQLGLIVVAIRNIPGLNGAQPATGITVESLSCSYLNQRRQKMFSITMKSALWVLLGALWTTPLAAQVIKDPDREPIDPIRQVDELALAGLPSVAQAQWTPAAVRKVLQSFAFGGHASDLQINTWAAMEPAKAIQEMLSFDLVNPQLSASQNDGTAERCHSLTELQAFWGSDHPDNPMRAFDRPYYALLSQNMQLRPAGLFLTWSRAMHTRGCNLFLHKMAFYLTNYHASIHIRNAGTALIRDYYDDTVEALSQGADFVDLMFQAASNGAVAFAYGHANNYVHPVTGVFYGNDDFAREYFQLLFGINGTSEDPEYHESVTIKNNAKLLTGMALDLIPDRFGSVNRLDWLSSDIDFSDHLDATGRPVRNRTAHYDFRLGSQSCLEIFHQSVCGATAEQKLRVLGSIAASHPESMASSPLKLVRFFADTCPKTATAKSVKSS